MNNTGALAEPPGFPHLPSDRAALDAVTLAQWQMLLRGEATTAAAWMRAAARLGNAEAQAVLGQWLLDGHGLAHDAVQALHWFLCAAQQGHAMAMNMAGRCHEQGWGTVPDAEKAAHWYRSAAETGLPQARYNLANLLAAGQGVAQDHATAFALYRQAAEQGYAKAFAKLGRYHEDGLTVPQDKTLAAQCYQRGAEGGDFRAQFCHAGMLSAAGRHAEALLWLRKVPDTATPRYLRQAGALLLEAADAEVQALGRAMLERAGNALAATA